MPKTKIKPFVMPNMKVAPLRYGEEAFRLSDQELYLRDVWAKESNNIWGTEVDFFSLRLKQSKRDPLYDEPTQREWSKAYRMSVWVSAPSQTPIVGEEGFRVHFDATAWIARASLEEVQAPNPTEGDVLRFWNTPFFAKEAAHTEVPKAGYFFDIIQAVPDGHLHDTASFVGFRVTIKRRSEFGPERKILPP